MLCGGAQQALAICLAAIAGRHETILVEELTYCGLLDAASLLHLRPKAVAMDAHGLRPDALDRQCRATGAKLLVLVPTFQNPTTAVMPEARRRDLVQVARRHDLIVVEDDVYGYLPEPRPPAIATLAPERTIYLIPTVIDQNRCAHLRMPRDMIFHGWSMRLFQAWQHSATMSS